MDDIIEVMYSCYECGIKKAKVNVPIRTTEDVVFWVEQIVGHQIKADHLKRSPFCTATSVQDLMIPITGVNKIGGPSLQ